MWEETSNVLSQLHDLLLCGYCHKPVHNPCTLGGCEHFFCRVCIEGANSNSCPVCGIPNHAKDIQTNRQIATAVSLCTRLRRLISDGNQTSTVSDITSSPTSTMNRPTSLNQTSAMARPVEAAPLKRTEKSVQPAEEPTKAEAKPATTLAKPTSTSARPAAVSEQTSARPAAVAKQTSSPTTTPASAKRASASATPAQGVYDFQPSPDDLPTPQSPGIVAGRTRRATKIKKKKDIVAKSNKDWRIGKSPHLMRRGQNSKTKQVKFVDISQSSDCMSDDNPLMKETITSADDNNAPCDFLGSHKVIDSPDSLTGKTDPDSRKSDNKSPTQSGSESLPQNQPSPIDVLIKSNQPNSIVGGNSPETSPNPAETDPKKPKGNARKRKSLEKPLMSPGLEQLRVGQKRRSLPLPSPGTPGGRVRGSPLSCTPTRSQTGKGVLQSMWASPASVRSRASCSPTLGQTRLSGSPALGKRNAKGETALQVAVIKGDVELVRSLMEDGASVNTKDHAGWTPLHEACNHGYTEIAELLLDNGASINTPGFDNDTALHDAIINNRVECVKLLVSRGASLKARNVHGKMATEYAVSNVMKQALQTPVVVNKASSTSSEHSQFLNDGEVVAMATGLTREQKSELQKCMQLLHGKVTDDYSNRVTHVVTVVNKDGQCPRTMKYLQAVVAGRWVVNFTWVETCLEYKGRVSEEAFEVPGTSTFPNSQAPKHGRLNQISQMPGLLDGCQMYLSGSFEYPTPNKEDLSLLIKLAGGTLLSREPKLTDQSQIKVPYHARPGSQLDKCCYYVIHDNKVKKWLLEESRICRVPASFIMDCIAQFEILDLPSQS